MSDFKYEINPNFDHVIDEKGNVVIKLSKIKWGESTEEKLDLRKWHIDAEGNERMSKGVSFLTEEGPNELVSCLLTEGYGDTREVIDSIKDREDFMPSLVESLNEKGNAAAILKDIGIDEKYYDPSSILLGDDDE